MDTTSKESRGDLLSRIEVVVACKVCDSTYSVPASLVRESQRILAEGCTGESPFECDALFYATLVEPEASVGLDVAPPNAAGNDLEERALQRWENEGGRSCSSEGRFRG